MEKLVAALQEMELYIDVNSQDVDELKKIEKLIILNAAKMLYRDILCLPDMIKFVSISSKINIFEPNTLKDCIDAFKKLKFELTNFGDFMVRERKTFDAVVNFIDVEGDSNDALKRQQDLQQVVDYSAEFFDLVAKIDKKLKVNYSKKEYLSIIGPQNEMLVEILDKIIKLIEENDNLKSNSEFNGFEFNKIMIEKPIKYINLAFLNEEKEPAKKIVKINTVSKEEQERIDAIKKANDFYEEFCNDFLRDLNKQIPLSTYDLYKRLINRFEKFVKNYNMPLSKDVSKNRAEQCYLEIEKFLRDIEEIKENSYSVGIYK